MGRGWRRLSWRRTGSIPACFWQPVPGGAGPSRELYAGEGRDGAEPRWAEPPSVPVPAAGRAFLCPSPGGLRRTRDGLSPAALMVKSGRKPRPLWTGHYTELAAAPVRP